MSQDMKILIEKLNQLEGEDFARVLVRNAEAFPYKTCEVMRGSYDDNEDYTEDGKFHVICTDFDVPPNMVRYEVFETAEEALKKFMIDGKPLSELAKDIDVSQEVLIM